jgi:putative pyruvate formate lyase activating enzyme
VVCDAIVLLGRDFTPTQAELKRRQFHPDNFCDLASAKYRDKYAEIARRLSRTELNNSWRRARELGLKFETTTFERPNTSGMIALLQV